MEAKGYIWEYSFPWLVNNNQTETNHKTEQYWLHIMKHRFTGAVILIGIAKT